MAAASRDAGLEKLMWWIDAQPQSHELGQETDGQDAEHTAGAGWTRAPPLQRGSRYRSGGLAVSA